MAAVAIILGMLFMLALAVGGLSLIVRSGESIGKSRREWKEMNNQRDFYRENPEASQADYIQHYILLRNQQLHAPQGASRQDRPAASAPATPSWNHPFPSQPSRLCLEGRFPNLVLRWDASQTVRPVDYYRVWFIGMDDIHIDFVDVDSAECSLELGDLLDPDIPERYVEVTATDVDGQPGITSRRLKVTT
jgi:hypothetical protein